MRYLFVVDPNSGIKRKKEVIKYVYKKGGATNQ